MGFVHVSFSSKLYIPFMCCVYKIFNLGNIFRLKILEEIKSKKKYQFAILFIGNE